MSLKAGLQHADVPDITDRIAAYLRPAQLILLGIYFFSLTVLENPFLPIQDFEKFKHRSFAKLWAKYGSAMSQEMPPGTEVLVATASGMVLDIGPGTGTQLHLFTPSRITKIYGAEPAIDMHPELKRSAEKAQLGGKYEVLAAGAEPSSLVPALAKEGVIGTAGQSSEGVFDTIVSVRALCGVPDQEETAAGLYRLLKPGGRLLLVEHVKQPYPNGGDLIGAILQRVYMFVGWSFWLGGCCLDRDTEAVLKKVAGPSGWREIKLNRLEEHAAIPYIVGEMTKA